MALFVPVPASSSACSSLPKVATPRGRSQGHGTGARAREALGLGLMSAMVSFRKGWKSRKVARRAEEMEMDLPALDLDPKALDSAPELSFMIEELPSRNSSSLIVQHRLGSETQIPAVLKLVAARIADMRFLGGSGVHFRHYCRNHLDLKLRGLQLLRLGLENMFFVCKVANFVYFKRWWGT